MLQCSIRRALLAGGTVLSLASVAFAQAPLPPADETARLETIEDLSESLANEVLDLSGAVRDRDLSRVGAYFADSIEAPPFPSAPGEPRPQVKWISLHGWAPPSGAPPDPRPIPHREFLASFAAFLDHFSEIEDVRFKVRGATFDADARSVPGAKEPTAAPGASGSATIAFFVWGRDGQRRREWAHGTADARVRKPESGPWQFTAFRVTKLDSQLSAASGVGPLGIDHDNDGDTDLFIATVGEQILLENRLVPDGKLAFVDVSQEAGVAVSAIGFSAAAGDVNGDGRPDLYVASYNRYGQVTPDVWYKATNGTPNLLFVSQPGGGYREEARRWGVDDRRWSYAAQFLDVDEDGKLDLYVVNDFGEKALYMRRGDRFVDEASERGVLDTGNGMGVPFGDFNNDGRLDLHVTNMSSTAGNRILGRLFPGATPDQNVLKKLASGNSLFENVGGGRLREVTAEAGPFGGAWAWGGGFIDFDNDSHEDFYSPNGFISGKSMKDT